MRRRPKPLLDASGSPLRLPDHLAAFTASEWPGVSEYHRWEHWWDAVMEWERENEPPIGFLDYIALCDTHPHMTEDDLNRLI